MSAMQRARILAPIFVVGSFLAFAFGEEPDEADPRALSRQVRIVAFSPDGKFLAVGSGVPKKPGELTVWNLSTRQVLWTHEEDSGVPGVAFSGDPGAPGLAIGTYDGTVKLFDASNGQVRKQFQAHQKEIRSIALTADGKTLATASWDLTIKLWDLPAGAEKRTLNGHTDRIYSVAFSPDGKRLISGGYDTDAKLWDVETGKQTRGFKHGGLVVPFAAFTADGQWVLTAGYDGTARVWDAHTGEIRARFSGGGGLQGLAYAPAVNILAVWDHEGKDVPIYNFSLRPPTAAESGRVRDLLTQLDDDSYALRNQAETALLKIGALAEPELRKASKDSPSAEVRIRCRGLIEQLQSKPSAFLKGHQAAVTFVAASPDGRVIASGSNDGTVRLWDAASRSELAVLRRR